MRKSFRSVLSSRNLKLPAQQSALLFSVIILLAGIITSLFLASLVARQARDDYRVSLDQKQNAIESHLSSIVAGYNQLLIAGATLFNMHGDLTAQEWGQYYEGMQVERQLPCTLGVGYVTVTRSEGGDMKTAITYIEPANDVNGKALGYDMYSEANRHEAMDRAIESANMAVTAPVPLVQDSGEAGVEAQGKQGVLMYYPVYTTRTVPMTIESRRQQLKGFVYIVVRPGDLLDGYQTISPGTFDKAGVVLTDTAGQPKQLAAISHVSGGKADRQLISGR